MLLMDKVKKFLDLKAERKSLEERLQSNITETAGIEQELLKEFEKDGLTSLRCDGQTVFLYRKLVARARNGDKDRLIKALLDSGLQDYVSTEPSYNTLSVEAWVKEHLNGEPNEDGTPPELPPALKEALDVTEVYFVRTRKAPS